MGKGEIEAGSHIGDMNNVYCPVLFRLGDAEQKKHFDDLLTNNPLIQVCDEIESHLRELIKSLHPSIKIKQDEYPELIDKHLDGRALNEYGVWAYYPWSNRVVHILDEEEFVEVRTNRNRYKNYQRGAKYAEAKKDRRNRAVCRSIDSAYPGYGTHVRGAEVGGF